ncbi:MAG: hypothetical protein ABH865_05155 [Candidatus Omnitrophota bacterium]|nr:hypothetical protein [Candidatus Omnitrophota bacterium]
MKKIFFVFFLLAGIIGCAQPERAGIHSAAATITGNSAKEDRAVRAAQRPADTPAVTVIVLENERIADEGKWGLSVYNPSTGVTEYYTSGGVFLARRMRS